MTRQKTMWNTSGICSNCNNSVLNNAVEIWDCSCDATTNDECACIENYEIHYPRCGNCNVELK